MLKLYKHISCLTCILLSLLAQGQDLPTLGTAPEIQRGSLPDGIQYYLVTQPQQKGHADFALVQRGRRDAAQARGMLRALPHFGDRAPYRFLADHGIGVPGNDLGVSTKRARQITGADYAYYDIILCMDHNNLRNLRRVVGEDTEGKVRLLLDYAGRPGAEVADPWYTGDFEATWNDVLAGCRGLLEDLRAESTGACTC